MGIFEIFISPFVFIIEQIFIAGYKLTQNYGVAIMLLSFGISLLLLPIFIYIEKVKKRNDAIKLKMQPLANEIKRCYKGQERHYYIQTLHRQANYSPFMAVLPAFSLLLQIPFFIAAYWFLESYTQLSGVKFGFISDLNQPDGLFGSINALPIIMTVVNLITAYFYTRHGDKAERKQMLVVAGIFLILLFNLPAGLVLYWTMNNVFSFVRLFVTNKEAFKKTEQKASKKFSLTPQIERLIPLKTNLLIVFAIVSVVLLTSNFSSLDSFAFLPVFKCLANSIFIGFASVVAIALLSLILYPKVDPKGNFKTHFKLLWPIYKHVFYMLGIAAAYSQYNWAREYQSYNDLVLRIPGAVMASFIITVILAFLFLIVQNKISVKQIASEILTKVKSKSFKIKKVHFTTGFFTSIYFLVAGKFYYSGTNKTLLIFATFAFTASLILTILYYRKNRLRQTTTDLKQYSKIGSIYSLAIVYVGSLIFFFNPIIVYSSFPEVFSFPAIDLFARNLLPFVLLLAICAAFYFIIPKKQTPWLVAFAVTMAFLSFVNNFIAPFNVGTLQLGKYIKEENLAAESMVYIMEIVLLVIAVLITKNVLLKKYIKQTTHTILVLFTILIAQSVITGINTGHFFQRSESAINLPSKVSFSKTKENIVYIIPDMFLGMHMNQILEESPELKKELKGFTWYPNTVSVSTNTGSSICSLFGGPDYNIDELNKDKRHTMTEKITSTAEMYVKKVKHKGYYFTGTHMPYSAINARLFDAYLPSWHTNWNQWNDTLNIGGSKDLDYTILWKNALFYTMPLAIKPAIYKKGEWVNVDNETNKNSQLTQYLNQTRLLPYISDTLNKQKSFIYYHSEATHIPWHIMDENGLLQKNVTPYKNHKWFIHQLVNWFKWMKENGVYDNTKIIIISDHGAFPPDSLLDGKYAAPYNWDTEGQKKISEKYFWRVNPILLVKEFNEQNNLIEDWRLMTNSDAPAIVFDENNPLKQPADSNRTVPVYFVEHDSKITTFKNLDIFKQFEISGNIYNPENWIEVR